MDKATAPAAPGEGTNLTKSGGTVARLSTQGSSYSIPLREHVDAFVVDLELVELVERRRPATA